MNNDVHHHKSFWIVFAGSCSLLKKQGSKKVPSGCPGQVDFPVRQVTFHSHLPNGQGPRQVICQLNCKKSNLRLAQGKQNLRANCPKGKLEFKFFTSPEKCLQILMYTVHVMQKLGAHYNAN